MLRDPSILKTLILVVFLCHCYILPFNVIIILYFVYPLLFALIPWMLCGRSAVFINKVYSILFHSILIAAGEWDGLVVEHQTLNSEVLGSIPTRCALLCTWVRFINSPKYWFIPHVPGKQ